MTILVFRSGSKRTRNRSERSPYRFATHVDYPHPFAAPLDGRDDQVWIVVSGTVKGTKGVVLPLRAVEDTPTVLVCRPSIASASSMTTEVNAVRLFVDEMWRSRMQHAIAASCADDSATALRFASVLRAAGVLNSATCIAQTLPSYAKRNRRIFSDRETTSSEMKMKEVLDWVFLLRVTAGQNVGATQAQRVAELGGSLRTYRRTVSRLAKWMPGRTKHMSPMFVRTALKENRLRSM